MPLITGSISMRTGKTTTSCALKNTVLADTGSIGDSKCPFTLCKFRFFIHFFPVSATRAVLEATSSLLLLLLPMVVQADSLSLPQLMTQFSNVESRTTDYVEKQYIAMLEIPLESHGTLTFHAPDILEKSVSNGGSYRVKGQQLQIRQNNELHHIALKNYPALSAFVASFRATLAGDLNTLEHYYTTALHGNANSWTLSLTPKQRDMATVIRSITLHGSENQIRLIETIETNGDSSRMQLRERHEK